MRKHGLLSLLIVAGTGVVVSFDRKMDDREQHYLGSYLNVCDGCWGAPRQDIGCLLILLSYIERGKMSQTD